MFFYSIGASHATKIILVIQSDFYYLIGESRATKIITPSDPTSVTDHLDHDSYYQVIVNRKTLLSYKCAIIFVMVLEKMYPIIAHTRPSKQ